eukprot:TRINITY_DN58148_c0_g1_i1.p1 TRINITY_DN58148_c0_g1~~TRINITY_DN58148_c0_g1_i1.p1  ORF type:complete len:510 (-),score=50.31 TRINITY_DN58148_c0_g1_i1:58-1587(-)
MGDTLSLLFVDVTTLPQGGFGFVQLLFLGAVYGMILFSASGMISNGSELLLLIPSLAGLVGSVVLPVLGAVPDGAIVLFSGMGPVAEAQEQLSVGVGALAGSTIMLLTIPWALSIIAGRVSLDGRGNPTYGKRPKLNPPGSWKNTGVGCGSTIRGCGVAMVVTAVSYIVIQGPAFGVKCGTKTQVAANECHGANEKWWSLVGLVLCIGFFIWYLAKQVATANSNADTNNKIDELRKNALATGLLSLRGVFGTGSGRPGETQPLLGIDSNSARFRNTLRPFFNKYDRNGDKRIDATELALLMRDLNEEPTPKQLKALLAEMDKDGNGTVEFHEFAEVVSKIVCTPTSNSTLTSIVPGDDAPEKKKDEEGEGEEDEEEEEMPSDLAHLPPEVQQRRLKMRAAWMMTVGTVIVLLFSDPMVAVLSEVGNRVNISPFYISFILAPLASNASELLASFNYAAKKTEKTVSISFAALLGAATMNNTFCLGIFLALVCHCVVQWGWNVETCVKENS